MGHLEVVRYFCDRGADKDRATQYGTTPLYIAAYQGHLEVVKCLCEHGADKQRATQGGWTPQYIAAQTGHHKVAHYLSGERNLRCSCVRNFSRCLGKKGAEPALS